MIDTIKDIMLILFIGGGMFVIYEAMKTLRTL